MRFGIRFTKQEFAVWCASWIAVVAILVCGFVFWNDASQPLRQLTGWSAEAEAEHAPIVAAMPAFAITDGEGNAIVQANERANVRLWHATLKLHGKHHPNRAQEGNDCTAQGAKHAIEILQDINIVDANGSPEDCHPVSAAYIYGRSRHPDGLPAVRGEGCSGAYTARCVMEGVIAEDTPGFPAYSGQLVSQWGSRGPPRQWVEQAKKFPIKQTSPCRSAAEVRDAVCGALCPVTIASNVGFDRIVVRDGRRVGVRSGEWPHQMVIIGFDGSGREPYWYVLNSWGEHKHGTPLSDEPPGGFWIGENDCNTIATTGTAIAYSSFTGFTAREFKFDLFSKVPRYEVPRNAVGRNADIDFRHVSIQPGR